MQLLLFSCRFVGDNITGKTPNVKEYGDVGLLFAKPISTLFLPALIAGVVFPENFYSIISAAYPRFYTV